MTDAPMPPASAIWINAGTADFKPETISAIERHYEATYIAHLCLTLKDNMWSEHPVGVFWVERPKLAHHSHYIGLFRESDSLMIVDARSVSEGYWNGMMADDGEIIFSRYRHDYVESQDGTAMVDGGRDYFKARGERTVRISIVNGKLWVNDVLSYPVRRVDA